MSKALEAAKNFDQNGINANTVDMIDEVEPYLGLPVSDDQVLGSKVDGTREWITIVTQVNWGDIGGTLSNQTDLQQELDNRYLKSETFAQNEFISFSNGMDDHGKPIVLNSQGQIDPSMLDTSSFYYVGPYDPSDLSNPTGEYPDTTNETAGAFWVVHTLINPTGTNPQGEEFYTFQSEDLIGKDITVGDFMVWGTAGWSIMASEMNPLLYYKLDGSQAITGPFAGGGQQFKNAADGTDPTDLITKSQLDSYAPEIGDIPGLQPALDEKVAKAGDTMTGSLIVDTTGQDINVRTEGDGFKNELWKDKLLITDPAGVRYEVIGDEIDSSLRFQVNDISSMKIYEGQPPSTQFDPTDPSHLVREDYVEPDLGTPAADGQILSSDTSGTRVWIDAPNSAVWGQITGTLSNQTDLWNELQSKANKSGDTFTGDVTLNYDLYVGSAGTGDSIINMWSESDAAYIPFYMSQTDGKFHFEGELYSSKFISSAGTIRTGYNQNNNSVYEFTDPSGPNIPTIFWDNINKDLYVDTNTTSDQKLWHQGNYQSEMGIPDSVQSALDDKENYLNVPSTDGMLLSSDTTGTRTWITPPQGVTDHELLTGRDKPDSHPISAVTNLQSELDSKVNKSGDQMTGNLSIASEGPKVSLIDTDDGLASQLANYPADLRVQTEKTNVIFEGLNGDPLNGEVLVRTSDGTHSFYHSGNDGPGSGLDADLLDGHDSTYFATEQELVDHNHDSRYYQQSEFIQTSTGPTDGGKPIILTDQGKIDPSMLDTSTFYYAGVWDPSDPDGPNDDGTGCDPTDGCEYPDTAGETHGAFWFTDVLSVPDNPADPVEDHYYTFTGGELAGKTIQFGDFMVWGSNGWSIMASQMNPLLYMRVDKSSAFLDNGNPLVVNGILQNVWDGQADNDAVTVSQLKPKLNKSGGTMTGSLVIDTSGETYVTRVEDAGIKSEQFKDKILFTDKTTGTEYGMVTDLAETKLRLKINNITGLSIEEAMAPSTPYQPTSENQLTRKDYVDIEISGLQSQIDQKEDYLQTPTSDGEVLTSLVDGTRQWRPVQDIIPQYPSMIRQRFIGDGSTTTFPIVESYTPGNADVYYNGVKLLTPEDVDISSGTEIVFTTAPEQDDIVEFVGFATPVVVSQPTP